MSDQSHRKCEIFGTSCFVGVSRPACEAKKMKQSGRSGYMPFLTTGILRRATVSVTIAMMLLTACSESEPSTNEQQFAAVVENEAQDTTLEDAGLAPDSHPLEFHLKAFIIYGEIALEAEEKETANNQKPSWNPSLAADDPRIQEIVYWNTVAAIRASLIESNPSYGLTDKERIGAVRKRVAAMTAPLEGKLGKELGGNEIIKNEIVPTEIDAAQTMWLIESFSDSIQSSINVEPSEAKTIYRNLMAKSARKEVELPLSGIVNDTRDSIRRMLIEGHQDRAVEQGKAAE